MTQHYECNVTLMLSAQMNALLYMLCIWAYLDIVITFPGLVQLSRYIDFSFSFVPTRQSDVRTIALRITVITIIDLQPSLVEQSSGGDYLNSCHPKWFR